MIQIADSDFNISKYIDVLAKSDPFGCRIKSLYNTYNYNLPFVDFWIQNVKGRCVALIARLESVFILRITDYSDVEELASFLRIAGASSIIADGKYSLTLDMNIKKGPILYCDSCFDNEGNFVVVEPTIREVHNVIKACESDNFNVPNYDSFALDVAHKLNSKTIRMYGIRENELESCIMTLAESDDCAVLGALATLPNRRGIGYGTFLIKYISNVLLKENKTVYLHRAPYENIEFYNKMGFKNYGIWCEYSLKD